jgi:23S rRNA C2498 (ribose-2'-O)-methylase RlmM
MFQILILCRPQYESALCDELVDIDLPFSLVSQGNGYIEITCEKIPKVLIFERQRILNCALLPIERVHNLSLQDAQAIFAPLIHDPMPWAPFLSTEEEAVKAIGIPVETILRHASRLILKDVPALKALERKAENLIAQNRGKLLHCFLCHAGLYFGIHEPARLSAKEPGGVRRMRFDSGAPSRSYLKVEEALALMQCEPQAKEKVVDLGAAPGGWSFAFAKRGCYVTSVDNGPLKIKTDYSGEIHHLRVDGPSFNPDPSHLPVDWLVADMLIPPAKALELLRKWAGRKWTKQLIVNIKIPQHNVYQGLKGVVEWIKAPQFSGLQIRQLYHDRQEVTIFGSIKHKEAP